MDALNAISPVDGRYRKYTEELARFSSEFALMQYRITVEIEYLLFLSKHPLIGLRHFAPRERARLRSIPLAFTPRDAQTIKDIEEIGSGKIKRTNHDVKAIEYFIRSRLQENSLNDAVSFVHFALTSEDVNNIAYGLMLADSLDFVLMPSLARLLEMIDGCAKKYRSLPMLARTHGQPASPTTLGKEFGVFSERIKKQLSQLRTFEICVKCNGATGNYNAHYAAYPAIDWRQFTCDFIQRFNVSLRRHIRLRPNLVTTQIEPHDSLAELFDLLRRINTICVDFAQDMWRYISDEWLIQKNDPEEIGSSTMPNKINPVDFENAEGNFSLANALLTFFSTKLPISRLQRDLSDSTVERNFGVAFAHCLIGYHSLARGLEKIVANETKIRKNLRERPEVVSEAIQTILRREGIPDAYEQLKKYTRGKKMTQKKIQKFIDRLSVPQEIKKELLLITPENYTGLASALAFMEE